ncbi:MAG: PilZ domain-containing protein [Bdellovibrionia bacterium]
MSAKRFVTNEKATIEIYGINASIHARMINLSTTGAAFRFLAEKFIPNKGDLLNIRVTLPAIAKVRVLDAEVVWINGPQIGVCFINKDEVVEKMMSRGPRL